jgi:hypothetical protein
MVSVEETLLEIPLPSSHAQMTSLTIFLAAAVIASDPPETPSPRRSGIPQRVRHTATPSARPVGSTVFAVTSLDQTSFAETLEKLNMTSI